MARAGRVTFSGDQLVYADLARDHADTEASVRLYFDSAATLQTVRFANYAPHEVDEDRDRLISQHDQHASLALLAAIEAAFRIDYLQRCKLRKKDALSRAFKNVFHVKEDRASLENDIFSAWQAHSDVQGAPRFFNELRKAFQYRHWLAHGRYWTPKHTPPAYDFQTLALLAEPIFNDFDLFEAS